MCLEYKTKLEYFILECQKPLLQAQITGPSDEIQHVHLKSN